MKSLIKTKNLLFFIAVIIYSGCRSDLNNKRKEAENTFKGYKKVITEPDSIPEIIPQRTGLKIINIPESLNKGVLDLDRIVDSIYFIKLETKDQSLIGDIDKILFYDDRILIVEKRKRSSILMFDSGGKYIRSIGNRGKGPEEYLSLRDVAVDYSSRRIVILDGLGRKILYYDFDGNYSSSQSLYFFSTDFTILEDGSYFFCQLRGINQHLKDVSEFNLLFAEDNQTITGKSIPFNYRDKFSKNTLNSLHSFNVLENKVLFCPVFSNYIFEIKKNNFIEATYLIDLGNKDIINHINNETTNQDFLNLLNTDEYFYFDGYAIESENFLYINIKHGGKCYYSKRNNKLYFGRYYRTQAGSKNILPLEKPITAYKDFFVSIVEPRKITNLVKANRNVSQDLKKLSDSLTEHDNPVLYYFRLIDYY